MLYLAFLCRISISSYNRGVKMQHIQTEEQFKQLLEGNEVVFFLKHSNTCNISETAFEEFEQFSKTNNVVTAFLVVQEDRPLSNYIAEQFGVIHHSPQVFKFENGQAVYNASHRKITVQELNNQL